MTGQFLQSTSSQFLSLKDGLGKAISGAENKLKDMLKVKIDICKIDTKFLIKNIEAIINQLKAITNIINSIISVLKKILVFIEFIQTLIIGLLVLVQILKFLPLPAMFTPVGVINTLGDLLAKITFQVAAALLIVTGLSFIINYISITLGVLLLQINSIIEQLKFLEQQILNCIVKKTDLSDDDKAKLAIVQVLGSTLDNLSNSINDLNDQLGSLLKSNNSYKGFVFQIVEEETTTQVIAKRRYAIAINTNGILTLKGELSYATDNQVLIDELKQIIDSQNLSGYPIQDKSTIQISTDTSSQTSTDSIMNMANAQRDLDDFINNNAEFKKLKEKIKI